MKQKFLSSLLLVAFFCLSGRTATWAAMYEGGFVPACNAGSILTQSKIKYYQIKPGDTLWDISRNHGVDVKLLMAMNDLNERSILAVGQVISIPHANARLHIIKPGETMWDIAVRYDVSADDLVRANKDKNPRNLKIGDTLKIPDDSLGTPMAPVQQPSRAISSRSLSYAWPLVGTITSAYGWRKSGFHHGLDIAGNKGDPIRAAADGVVIFSGYKPVYGNMVILKHTDERQTVYAHAQALKVREGQKVRKGQIIATVGTTGRTTGPHVHFEIREHDKTKDPLKFLRY